MIDPSPEQIAIEDLAGEFCQIVCDEIHGEGVWSWCDDLRQAKDRIAERLRLRLPRVSDGGVAVTLKLHEANCRRQEDRRMIEALVLELKYVESLLEVRHAAIRTVLRGFDEGVFVRSTDGDSDPAWAIKVFPFIRALGVLQQALAEEGATRPLQKISGEASTPAPEET
jgi:hypothetical protein